jgi:phenylacetate-coenzyme A ligase PaaK-like adenylate-forming protein
MLIDSIFNIKTTTEFEDLAIQIFNYQATNCTIYKRFLAHLKIDPRTICSIKDIPFLPIEFFKSHTVLVKEEAVDIIFSSSGTSGTLTSKHHVSDVAIYKKSYLNGFAHFYGNIEGYIVLALLPSYLERKDSSLIYMVDDLIKRSKHPESGFFLKNHQKLAEKLNFLDKNGQKALLIGVSFALLDLIEKHSFNLKNTIIMETGGMKGRRKELIRSELHNMLSNGFGVSTIHSEYGMTELLSQAYSIGNGIFRAPPWMQVLVRDAEDPLSILPHQKTGGINVIDLANINSCSFIATQDLGKTYVDGTFEILGRFDNSDIRGCNLMVY